MCIKYTLRDCPQFKNMRIERTISVISTRLFNIAFIFSLPVVEDKPTHKPRGRLGPHVLPDDQDNVRVTCCGVQEEKKSKE